MTEENIKVSPKLEKKLAYLGFEEKSFNIDKYSVYKRYFVHPSGLQLRVNMRKKDITVLSKKGYHVCNDTFMPTSYIKGLIAEYEQN